MLVLQNQGQLKKQLICFIRAPVDLYPDDRRWNSASHRAPPGQVFFKNWQETIGNPNVWWLKSWLMMVYGFKSISLQSIEVQVWVNIQNSGANV